VNRYIDADELRSYAQRNSAVMDDEPADREISLGMPMILGIFFALALVCAAFFGFGYTMGRRSSAPAPVVMAETPVIGSVANKPSAGSAAAPVENSNTNTARTTAVVPMDNSVPAPAAPTEKQAPATSQPVPTATPQAPTEAGVPGQLWVQIAAVSSQEIADIEVAALKKDGYAVVVRHEPQDKLLHVQIGPFTEKKSAEAMRQKVLADGFNAIVK
jgi:cell division septation protein DedD